MFCKTCKRNVPLTRNTYCNACGQIINALTKIISNLHSYNPNHPTIRRIQFFFEDVKSGRYDCSNSPFIDVYRDSLNLWLEFNEAINLKLPKIDNVQINFICICCQLPLNITQNNHKYGMILCNTCVKLPKGLIDLIITDFYYAVSPNVQWHIIDKIRNFFKDIKNGKHDNNKIYSLGLDLFTEYLKEYRNYFQNLNEDRKTIQKIKENMLALNKHHNVNINLINGILMS